MIGLLLEVFYWKETDEDEEDITLEPMIKSDIEERYFLTIDNYGKFIDIDGNEYTAFASGGHEYVTMYKLKDFQELLLKHFYGKA